MNTTEYNVVVGARWGKLTSPLVERINAGLNRVRAEGVKRIGRPPTPTEKIDKAKKLLGQGTGIRATAKKVKVSAVLVQRLKHEMVVAGDLLPS